MPSAKPYHQPNGNFSHDFIHSKPEMILLFLLDGTNHVWTSVVYDVARGSLVEICPRLIDSSFPDALGGAP
jgi:hypothetical protein